MIRIVFLLSTLLAIGVVPPTATSVRAEPNGTPPSLSTVRYSEEYSYLRDATRGEREQLAPWTELKYIRVGESDDRYLSLGLELRLRYEAFKHNNWGEGEQDNDGYLWSRALPLADLHLGKNVRIFGQLIAAFVNGLEVAQGPVDEDRLDILQAFLDLRLPTVRKASVTLRPGRQLLQYGSGRLIDVRYGPNVLETFDAMKAFMQSEEWKVDVFYARPVEAAEGEFDDSSNNRRLLWSVYSTFTPQAAPSDFDLYYIGYRDLDAVFDQGSGRELRHTLGARVFGEARQWDWNFESFYQFGDFDTTTANSKIAAWSVASDTGYTLSSSTLRPRIGLKANIISGDRNPKDARLETFNPLFPKGKYFGELSPLAPYNLIHLNPSLRLEITESLQLTANTAFYWRESDGDGIYSLGGSLLRPDGGTSARYIGTQAELFAEYQATRHLSLLVSYSIFTAGNFIEVTGAHQTIHFLGMESLYRF